MSASELQLDLGMVTMNCTSDEVAETLAALLGEMRSVIPKLREDERDVLRQIMSRDSGELTVGEVFPVFTRESEGHKTLRRLRAAQFIRPAHTGRWDSREPIAVKPFARLMWDHVGEDAIFDGVVAAPASAVPVAAPAQDVVDLGLEPEVNGASRSTIPKAPTEEVVDLQDVDEVQEPVEAAARAESAEPAELELPEPAPGPSKSSKFEDDNLDLGDYDDLCAYAEEEIRGK